MRVTADKYIWGTYNHKKAEGLREEFMAFPKSHQVLAYQLIGSKLFLVVPEEIYEVDMAQLAVQLFSKPPVKPPVQEQPLPIPPVQEQPVPIPQPVQEPQPEQIEKPLDEAEIRELQELLLKHGYDPKGIDGIIGVRTRGAITNYQRENNLPVDGKASRALLSRLKK